MTAVTPERYCRGCGADVVGRGPEACTCEGGPRLEQPPASIKPTVKHHRGCPVIELSWPENVHSTCTCDAGEERGTTVDGRAAQLRSLLLSTDGLDSLPPPEPLLDGILMRDSLAWLHGKPGHGKSFIAVDWAGCIAGGVPWQRREVVTRGLVVYLIAEGASGLTRRVRAWEQVTGERMKGVAFLPAAVQLLNYVDREALVQVLTEVKPVLVVVDTQARVTVGAEENSAKDMGMLVDAVDQIREATRACVLLVHHESRAGENMRGSTALEGAATTIIRVTKDGPHMRLDCTKQKDGAEFDPMLLRLVPTGDSAVIRSQNGVELTEELSNSEEAILEVMRDSFGTTGASSTRLLETTSIPRTSFYRALNLLVTKGQLTNCGTKKRPLYFLPGSAPDE
jgi:hypothetical protein